MKSCRGHALKNALLDALTPVWSLHSRSEKNLDNSTSVVPWVLQNTLKSCEVLKSEINQNISVDSPPPDFAGTNHQSELVICVGQVAKLTAISLAHPRAEK